MAKKKKQVGGRRAGAGRPKGSGGPPELVRRNRVVAMLTDAELEVRERMVASEDREDELARMAERTAGKALEVSARSGEGQVGCRGRGVADIERRRGRCTRVGLDADPQIGQYRGFKPQGSDSVGNRRRRTRREGERGEPQCQSGTGSGAE